MPGAQAAHAAATAAPGVGAALPAAQLVQLPRPVRCSYWPAGQLVQAVEPVGAKAPAAHTKGQSAVAPRFVPYLPAEHRLQLVCFAAFWYRPATHVVQLHVWKGGRGAS